MTAKTYTTLATDFYVSLSVQVTKKGFNFSLMSSKLERLLPRISLAYLIPARPQLTQVT